MKKLYQTISSLLLVTGALTSSFEASAQCAVNIPLGTASNMFTLIRNGNHSIAVDKTMNMAVFIHRNDAGFFGGSSGNLRYDYTTTSGATWTLNQGYLNPANTNLARYPNVAIYNPSLNTTPSNAWVSYMAPTINSLSSVWNGVVTGVQQASGAGTTEAYNQGGIGTDQIPHSLVKGAPGVFWAIDPVNIIATSYNIYKGVWNNNISDIQWTLNYNAIPGFASGWTGAPQVVDYNIAFHPAGQIGYFSFLGHISSGSVNNAIYPILYKTIDGGLTWTGPIEVDLSLFGCVSANITSPNVPSANTEHDLVVDVNGNPHIITTLGGSSSNIFNYNGWHHMYDITLKNGFWVGYDLGNVNGAPNMFGISPDIAWQWQAPQAARSADGTKVFFTWTDNSGYTLGQTNSTPDLYSKAYDVNLNTWTQTKNFTSCNTGIAGKIMFPHLAAEVLEPTGTSYKLAAVYGEPSSPNNLLVVANFHFLNNLLYSNSEFTVPVPPATVTIAQAPTIIYCPNSTVNMSVTGAGQVLWSNSSTLNPMPVTTGTISVYSVTAQVGCLIGTASVSVVNLTVNSGAVTPSICPGAPATFTASGNALSYSWLPGTATGTNAILNPTSGSVTLTAMGSAGCTFTSTVPVTIMQPPTITIAGTSTTCVGSIISQTASGAASYLWSDATTNNTYTSIAVSNTIIGVIGTGANSCTMAATVSVAVSPTPVVNVVSSATSVCMGQSIALQGSGGASSYSWNGVSTGPNVLVTPATNTVYSLTGANSFGCSTTKTIAIVVFPVPTLTVTQSRPYVCKGEKVTLTASGGTGYEWLPIGALTSTVSVTGSSVQTYSYNVNITSVDGCTNTGTYQLVVSACVGIGELLQNDGVAVYPNPNNGAFFIKAEHSVTLKLFNELGQELQQIDLNARNDFKSSVEALPSGIYFLTGQYQQEKFHQKIIVSQ